MDRQIVLRFGDEEVYIGYASDFLYPREPNETLPLELFDCIRGAIESLEIGSCSESEPIVITVE